MLLLDLAFCARQIRSVLLGKFSHKIFNGRCSHFLNRLQDRDCYYFHLRSCMLINLWRITPFNKLLLLEKSYYVTTVYKREEDESKAVRLTSSLVRNNQLVHRSNLFSNLVFSNLGKDPLSLLLTPLPKKFEVIFLIIEVYANLGRKSFANKLTK